MELPNEAQKFSLYAFGSIKLICVEPIIFLTSGAEKRHKLLKGKVTIPGVDIKMHRPLFRAVNRSFSGILRESCGLTAAYIIWVWNVLNLLSQAECPRRIDVPLATLKGSGIH